MLKFTDKVIGNVSMKITESDIEAIIVGSFEGGSNYWMGLDNSTPEWDEQPTQEPNSTWAAKLLLDGKTVTVYDMEDEDARHELTLEKLIGGIQSNYYERKHDNNLENADATTYDCIVQYAIFDEVVYG